MTNDELDRSLRQLRLGGMADTLSVRSQQARAESSARWTLSACSSTMNCNAGATGSSSGESRPPDFGSKDARCLRLEVQYARPSVDLRACQRSVHRTARRRFAARECRRWQEPIAQAIGMAAIHAGFRVLYREAHVLFEDLLLANATGDRAQAIAVYSEIPLLIIDDLGMRKLPASAAEDLLEIVMRRYERASTILTSNRPLDDWPKIFGDTPAVAAFLDRLMHHSHLIEIRGKSYRLHEHSLAARNRKGGHRLA